MLACFSYFSIVEKTLSARHVNTMQNLKQEIRVKQWPQGWARGCTVRAGEMSRTHLEWRLHSTEQWTAIISVTKSLNNQVINPVETRNARVGIGTGSRQSRLLHNLLIWNTFQYYTLIYVQVSLDDFRAYFWVDFLFLA
jgi:hypothetical protein